AAIGSARFRLVAGSASEARERRPEGILLRGHRRTAAAAQRSTARGLVLGRDGCCKALCCAPGAMHARRRSGTSADRPKSDGPARPMEPAWDQRALVAHAVAVTSGRFPSSTQPTDRDGWMIVIQAITLHGPSIKRGRHAGHDTWRCDFNLLDRSKGI